MVRHLHIDLASAHSVASVGRTTKLYCCSDASLIKCEIYRGKDTANINEMRKQEQNEMRAWGGDLVVLPQDCRALLYY